MAALYIAVESLLHFLSWLFCWVFFYQVLSAMVCVCVCARLCGKTNESAAVFVQMVHLAEIS